MRNRGRERWFANWRYREKRSKLGERGREKKEDFNIDR